MNMNCDSKNMRLSLTKDAGNIFFITHVKMIVVFIKSMLNITAGIHFLDWCPWDKDRVLQ